MPTAPPPLRGTPTPASAPEAAPPADAPETRAPEQPAAQALFQPPEVEAGDIVIWRNYGVSGPGVPAIVTRVNADRTLALSVFVVGQPMLNAMDRESVLHKDDPRFKQQPHYQSKGSWFLSPREQNLRELLAYLKAEVEKLKAKTKV